jgi:hypothetical protein
MVRMKVVSVVLTALTMIALGCSKAPTTNTNSASNSNAAPAAKAGKKTPPAEKVVPVPASWISMADEQKGYGFKVPEGTEHQTQTTPNGVDVFLAKTPAPSSVSAFVMAFTDKTLTKDDLLKFATAFLEGMGEKNVKIGSLIELSDDYSLGTISSVDEKGKVTKGKVLVATDVSDNYVMLLGTDESEFQANEKIMDEIWGSFTMRSGGASRAS